MYFHKLAPDRLQKLIHPSCWMSFGRSNSVGCSKPRGVCASPVGMIFRYAIVTGRAKHDPSADLRGAVSARGRKRGHKAMSRDELPNFLHALEVYDGDPRTRIALQLIMLTFVRTGELRVARWREFENLQGAEPLWRVPANE